MITYYSLETRLKRRKEGGAKTSIHLQILIKQENQVVLSTITDGQKWHYLAVRKLSVLLEEVASIIRWIPIVRIVFSHSEL